MGGSMFDPEKFEEQMRAWGEQIGADLAAALEPLALQANAMAVIVSLLNGSVDEAERILRNDVKPDELARIAFICEATAHICTGIIEERNS